MSTPWLTTDHLLGPDLNEGLVAPDMAWVWGDPRKFRNQTHETLGGTFWVGPREAVSTFAHSLAADSAARALRCYKRKAVIQTPKAVALWCPSSHAYALVGALSEPSASTSQEILTAVSETAALSKQYGPLLKLTDAMSPGSVWMFVTALSWNSAQLPSFNQAQWQPTQAGPALRLAFATSQPEYWEGLRAQMRQHSPELLAVHNASALEDAWCLPPKGPAPFRL